MVRKSNGKAPSITEEEWREFDKEFIADTFRPLSKASRERWESIPRGETVEVPIRAQLLKKVDALAKKKRVSRELLIERVIEAMLAGASRTK